VGTHPALAGAVRADAVLVVAIAFAGGAALPIAPLATLCAAAGVFLVLRPHLGFGALLTALVAFGCGGWRAQHDLAAYHAHWLRARDELGSPRRCTGSAIVTSSPVRRGAELSYRVRFSELECDDRRMAGPIEARLASQALELGRGDTVRLIGDFGIIEQRQNAELASPWPSAARRVAVVSGVAFDVEALARGSGIRAWVDRQRAAVRERISATFSARAEPLARALVLGESDLSDEDDEAFRKAGLLHLLAVSGTHLVFAIVAAVRALTFVLVRIERLAVRIDVSRLASAVGAPLSLLYADFAGGSGSAWRAAYMLCAVLGARALDRRPSASRSMAAALLVGAALEPLALFDVSFMLSAAATAGLLWLGPILTGRVARLPSRVARFVAQSMAATVASMVPCAPLLALMSPELTIAGLFANVLAAPFGEFVSLPLCLLHTLLAPFPALERGVALVASGSLIAVQQIAHEAAAVDGLSAAVPPPSAFHFALLAVAMAGLLCVRFEKRWNALLAGAWVVGLCAALGLLEYGCRVAGAPRGELRATILDVGQGDATLLDFPDGSLWLVDAGGIVGASSDPGQRVVLPILRERRRRHLDVVVLSHPHPDHFLGLVSVIDQFSVGELWDTGQGEKEGAGPAYRGLLERARQKGVIIRRPHELCGTARKLGAASVRVFGPCPGFVPGRNANDNSFVIKLKFGERALLLTGDAEAEEEHELVLRHGSELAADVLKVGHHGSRTSTSTALLAAVQPQMATVSTGLRNRFGHPHAIALERLAGAGVPAYRVDRLGSIEVRSDGRSLRVQTGASW
jgi:competence protein ComEC